MFVSESTIIYKSEGSRIYQAFAVVSKKTNKFDFQDKRFIHNLGFNMCYAYYR